MELSCSRIKKTHIHKFGGSSLSCPDSFLRVAQIIKSHTGNGMSSMDGWVVVSAAGKTTNRLINVAEKAFQEKEQALSLLMDIAHFQLNLFNVFYNIDELFEQELIRHQLSNELQQDIDQLKKQIFSCDRLVTCFDDWVCFGELWSARLMAQLLTCLGKPAKAVDSRSFILCDGEHVDLEVSKKKLSHLGLVPISDDSSLKVVTGYIASDKQGRTVTLGRNGSDYSASLCARLTGATKLFFWSDVSGIYSADPNRVEEAYPLAEISWELADTLAKTGSPVLHTRTLDVIGNVDCEVFLKNSHHPSAPGTKIVRKYKPSVCLVSAVNHISLLASEELTKLKNAHVLLESRSPENQYCFIKPEFRENYSNSKEVGL
ncbi:amino acid kinase family protein, partial [Vibrio azureus]